MKIIENKPAKPVMATLVLLMGVVLSFTLMSCNFSPELPQDNEREIATNDEVSVETGYSEKVYSRTTIDDSLAKRYIMLVT